MTASVARRRVRLPNRHARASLLAAAMLLGASACIGTDAGTGPTNQDPVGTYGLIKIDGRNPPMEVYNGPYQDDFGRVFDPVSIAIEGGELSLNEDGTFLLNVDLHVLAPVLDRRGTFSVEGFYELQGGKVHFIAWSGEDFGTLRNGILTLREDIVGNGDTNELTFRHA